MKAPRPSIRIVLARLNKDVLIQCEAKMLGYKAGQIRKLQLIDGQWFSLCGQYITFYPNEITILQELIH